MNKKQKVILGLIGEESHLRLVVGVLLDFKFDIYCLNYKIKKIAEQLIGKKDLSENELNDIRTRGYKVNQFYWINLLLASIQKESRLIAITGLQEIDIVSEVILPIYITDNINVFLSEHTSVSKKHIIDITSSNFKHDLMQKIKT